MTTIRLADRNFHIINKYQFVEELCRGYEITEYDASETTPIEVSEVEIESERLPDENCTLPLMESTAIYRKICESLIPDGVFLFHCAAIEIGGQAILFAAPSGTGKSTHAGLWKQTFGDQVTIINDDKPLIRLEQLTDPDDESSKYRARVYGTPWSGKHYLNTNTNAVVSAVVLLEQDAENSIEQISKHDAFPMVLNQTYRPDNAELMLKTIELAGRFTHSIDFFRLKCNISEDAVHTVYNEIIKEHKDIRHK